MLECVRIASSPPTPKWAPKSTSFARGVVGDFLDMLAGDLRVRVATQHQALNAVVRFHEEVLGRKVLRVLAVPVLKR